MNIVAAVSVSNAFAAPVAPAPVNAKAVAVKTAPAMSTIVVVGKRLSKAKRAA
jgi:hypothetical protein